LVPDAVPRMEGVMAYYRKKPVVIEAEQLRTDNAEGLAQWCGGVAMRVPTDKPLPVQEMPPAIFIETLEGDMRADLGDWIIQGIKGEFYPCKPDIFEATYEEAPNAVR